MNNAKVTVVLTLWGLLLITYAQGAIIDNLCQQFDGTSDDCIPIQNCPSLYALDRDPNITQSDIDLLRSRECDGLNKVNYVCCPKPKSPPTIDDSFEPCQTALRANGECMPQQTCWNMLKIEQNPELSQKFKAFAQRNSCGYANGKQLVCCPKIELLSQPPRAAPTTVTAEALSPPTCRTLTGTLGECTARQNCKSIGESVCDATNPNEPKVCCPKALIEIADEPNANPRVGTVMGTCVTPNGAAGTCVSLEQCDSLKNNLEKKDYLEYDIKYVRASLCSHAVELPVVCCPDVPEETVLPLPPYCGRVSTENSTDSSTTETEIDEYPWTALVISTNAKGKKKFICAGTLIHERFVLTGAHCIPNDESSINSTGVRLGEWAMLENRDCQSKDNKNKLCAPPHIEIAVAKFIAHPKYDFEQNNIALILLAEVVQSTRFISPICLPFGTDQSPLTLEGTAMTIAGWSATTTDQARSFKTKATFTVRNFAPCKDQYLSESDGANETKSLFCASGDNAADTSILEVGGALMALQKIGKFQSYILVGVECVSSENSDFPILFTQIGSHLQWLEEQIKLN